MPAPDYLTNQNFDAGTAKPVLWNSAKEAKQCGFIPTNISACINGSRKTHKKFIWKRKEHLLPSALTLTEHA
jgi:hypothetical protein